MTTRLFHPAFGRRGARPAPVRVRNYGLLPRRPSWLFRLMLVSAVLTWLLWIAAALGAVLHG